MYPLVIGIAIAFSLLIVALIAKNLIENTRNAHENMEWLKRHGRQVKATVTEVQTKQDWKYGERWYRDPWDGKMKREKTWQTYYDITAQWMHPQTQQRYTSHCKVWSTDMAEKPTRGNPLLVIVDPHNPGAGVIKVTESTEGC